MLKQVAIKKGRY